MKKTYFLFVILFASAFFYGCNNNSQSGKELSIDSSHSCMNVPSRFGNDSAINGIKFSGDTSVTGMLLIPAGKFEMGADNNQADPDEYPKHTVETAAFYMDITEVTNAQFQKFVDATGYITTAEKAPDWNEIKKSLPEGTPKPHDSVFVAASLVFKKSNTQ